MVSNGRLPQLKVDTDQLGRLGDQLLSAAGELPDAPQPFVVSGRDALNTAIAERLPSIEGPIQEALRHLRNAATTTATNVVTAAAMYATTDARLAADYRP